MTELYRGTHEERVEDSVKRGRALVPETIIPSGVRLALLLPQLESVAERVAQQESYKEQSREVLEDARSYLPEYAREVFRVLSEPLSALNKSGVDLNSLDVIDTVRAISSLRFGVKEKREDRLTIARSFDEESKDRRRDVQKVLHPDKNIHTPKAVFEKAGIEVYISTSEASGDEAHDADLVNLNFLRTMPSYLLSVIREGLRQGMSLEEIQAKNRHILEKASEVIYLSHAYLPFGRIDEAYLPPREALEKAKKIKRHDDDHEEVYVTNAALTVLAGLATYVRQKGISPRDYGLDGLADSLLKIAAYYYQIAQDREQRNLGFDFYIAGQGVNIGQDQLRDVAQKLSTLTMKVLSPDGGQGVRGLVEETRLASTGLEEILDRSIKNRNSADLVDMMMASSSQRRGKFDDENLIIKKDYINIRKENIKNEFYS